MPVQLTNRQRRFHVNGPQLAARARACLEHLGLAAGELSVLLVNNRAIRSYNRDWRGVDAATDVISFPMLEGTPTQMRRALEAAPEGDRALGDVVISVEQAYRQADEAGVAPDAELALLMVHGILHLVGYDHEAGAAAARAMRAAEREALTWIGVEAPGLIDRSRIA
jgi:probable rRNA maturation factor